MILDLARLNSIWNLVWSFAFIENWCLISLHVNSNFKDYFWTVVMPCTFKPRPSIILDLSWFICTCTCRPNADDTLHHQVSWWRYLWKGSWMHLHFKMCYFWAIGCFLCRPGFFGWIYTWMICIWQLNILGLVNWIDAWLFDVLPVVTIDIELRTWVMLEIW